jgi:pimeloyl-ACP methyl ester carboxylesterase
MDLRHVQVESGDCTLHAAVQGEGPLVLLVHGWPETGHSWRRQMAPLARAGFTVAALDLRGCGKSDAPHAVEAYSMQNLVGDLQAAADQLGGGQAVLAGHDWGAAICWNAALIDPKRFRAVAGLAIPYVGQGQAPFIDVMRRVFSDRGRFFYQVYMQDEGVAEAEMEVDIPATLRRLYHSLSGDAGRAAWPDDKVHGDTLLHRLEDPGTPPAWMGQRDFDAIAASYARTGFRGVSNLYRNFRTDFAWLQQYAQRRIEQPAMFIAGDRDPALRLFRGNLEARMRNHVPGLSGYYMLQGCGHWTQQERANTVSRLLTGWLKAERLDNRNAARRAA